MGKLKKLKKLATGGYATDLETDENGNPVRDKTGLHIRGVGAAAQDTYNDLPGLAISPSPINMGTPLTMAQNTANPYLWRSPVITDKQTFVVPANKTPPKNPNYGATAAAIVPYVSNIVNTFRTPAAVPNPHLDSPVNLAKANYNNDRYAAETGVRSMYDNADKTLDENTAQKVKQYTLAQRFSQLSSINQNESNQNVGIRNQQTQLNAAIAQNNNRKLDQMDQENVGRSNAWQTQSSMNLANGADKYIMQKNESDKRDLDTKKFGAIADIYNKNGVSGRKWASLSEMQKDPAGLQLLDNGKKSGLTVQQIFEAQNEDYNNRKEQDTNSILNMHKFGGALKYSTGGMMNLVKSSKKGLIKC